jgi:hypothetical protein
MLAAILTVAMMQSICPMTIGVGLDGTFYSDRFHGWYKITPRTLQSDLRGGCYNDANPHAVTSVKIVVAKNAPESKVDQALSILAKEGWPRDKINIQSWTEYPRQPY